MVATARTRSAFFLYMSLGFLAVALIGFSTTFFLPLARGTFTAPPVVYVHGALLFGWLLLFIAQTMLIRHRRVSAHRRAGWAGAVLSISIVISGVAVGAYATHRDVAAGAGDFALGQFVNIVIEMMLFGAFVAAAVVVRRNPGAHKRLLLLATISALGPAWLRFRHILPAVENPFVVFSLVADSLILVAVAHDWFIVKRLHPVYVWAGSVLIAVHAIELWAGDSAMWVRLGRWLLGLGQ